MPGFRLLPLWSPSPFACWGGRGTHAICSNSRILSSAFPRGSLSYILTPGVQPSPTGSSVTNDVEGFFWAVGAGHPSHLQGQDNAAFVARGESGWLLTAPGYPAAIHSAWSAARLIDGCIDEVTEGTKCTAVLLSDQAAGRGYFALIAAASDLGNYSLVQPGGAPIVLAALAKPQVLEVVTTPLGPTAVTARVDTSPGGTYLDSECPSGLVVGYRLYIWKANQVAPVPADLRRQQQSGGWSLAEGGQGPTGQPLPLGNTTVVTRDCAQSEVLYLAASLVFDSGFETAHLSEPTGPIHCGDE